MSRAALVAWAERFLGKRFSEIVLLDIEYRVRDGDLPHAIVCLVALELRSGKLHRIWADEIYSLKAPPFPIGADSVMICYNATAELSCFLHLGWKFPSNVIDFMAEFLNLSNGYRPENGKYNILVAQNAFSLGALSDDEKSSWRTLIMDDQNHPELSSYSPEQREGILDYCHSDVDALEKLFPKIISCPEFDVRFALNRGRYMSALTLIEANGISVDPELLRLIDEYKEELRSLFIRELDEQGFYVDGEMKYERVETFILRQGYFWPEKTEVTGRFKLTDEVLEQKVEVYPELEKFRRLQQSLSALRGKPLPLGGDGRNRGPFFPFKAKTSRNAPSSAKFIFARPKWMRHAIKPREGWGSAYIDYEQQEFAIAAYLSGDKAMQEAYQSGDPYIGMGKLARVLPDDATKKSHPFERKLFKHTVLATQYLMGPKRFARRLETLGLSHERAQSEAVRLLGVHRKAFPVFWGWSDGVLAFARLKKWIYTKFGFYLHISPKTKERTIRNFPMQAHGAEMIRIAAYLASESGVRVCALVHDAMYIEAPLPELDQAIETTRRCMARASEIVLGIAIRTDVQRIAYPNRYTDEEGSEMWGLVGDFLMRKGWKDNAK